MCMLTFLPPNVQPNTDRLRNGTVSNRDGHGWAIVVLADDGTGSHILTGHSMNATAAIEAFKRTREQHPEGPALFHSRFTTGGLVDESNCHPYVVDGDPRTILAHNGVLPYQSLGQPHTDDRSDTRYFCDVHGHLLYPGGEPGGNFNLNSKRGRRRLRDWLGNPNKFVVLTVDPTFKRTHYLINEEQGVWEDDGCWYSNTGYKEKTYGIGTATGYGGWSGWESDYATPRRGYKKWWEDAEERPRDTRNVWTRLAQGVRRTFDKATGHLPPNSDLTCVYCETADSIDPTYVYCRECGTCSDCLGDVLDEWADLPCECAWPMGTHPGRKARVEAAFAEGSADVRAAANAAAIADAKRDSATGWPTDIGPADDAAEGARAALEGPMALTRDPHPAWSAYPADSHAAEGQ